MGVSVGSKGDRFEGGLKARILSALLLAPIVLAVLFWGVWPTAVLVMLCAVFVLREWFRMIGEAQPGPAWAISAIIVVGAIVAELYGHVAAAFGLVGLAGLIAAFLFRKTHPGWAFMGTLYAGLPGLGFVLMRTHPDGVFLVLALVLVVWATDTAAFMCGRMIGGAKLWPKVSPNKTWSGAIGGLVGGALMGCIAVLSPASPLSSEFVFAALLIAAVLSISGQFGDLFESYVKRRFGVKDSGGMIPGHGGAMDRLDSVGTAAAVAGIMIQFS